MFKLKIRGEWHEYEMLGLFTQSTAPTAAVAFGLLDQRAESKDDLLKVKRLNEFHPPSGGKLIRNRGTHSKNIAMSRVWETEAESDIS